MRQRRKIIRLKKLLIKAVSISLLVCLVILAVLARGKPLVKEDHHQIIVQKDIYGNWVETQPEQITYYAQTDERWSEVMIGDGQKIRNNGCVPSVAAMILTQYGYEKTPLEMAEEFHDWGHYNAEYGHGTDSGVWRQVSMNYGLSMESCETEAELEDALKSGMMVAACIKIGYGAHCVLLVGLTPDKKTTVYDPIYGTFDRSVEGLFQAKSEDPVDQIDGGPIIAIDKA